MNEPTFVFRNFLV